MRFLITLSLQKNSKNVISFSHSYEMYSAILKVIRNADEAYSDFLHNHGYQTDKKNFKLFCFSNLHIPKKKIDKERESIIILSQEISFMISFYLDTPSQVFLMSLFQNQQIEIADKVNKAKFEVKQVELVPLKVESETVKLRTLSPLVIGLKHADNSEEYISPLHKEFEFLFIQNLWDKYKATHESLPPHWQDYPFHFTLLSEPKSKLVKIKANTKAETRIRGYLFDFEVSMPKELIEVLLLCGGGKNNALGFGSCDMFWGVRDWYFDVMISIFDSLIKIKVLIINKLIFGLFLGNKKAKSLKQRTFGEIL